MKKNENGIEVFYDDRVWVWAGNNLIVGYVVDSSPDNIFIAIANCKRGDYIKSPNQHPHTWLCVKYLLLEDIKRASDEAIEEKPIFGFQAGVTYPTPFNNKI